MRREPTKTLTQCFVQTYLFLTATGHLSENDESHADGPYEEYNQPLHRLVQVKTILFTSVHELFALLFTSQGLPAATAKGLTHDGIQHFAVASFLLSVCVSAFSVVE